MATLGYVIIWFTAVFFGLIGAWGTHAAQAFLNTRPQKLFDEGDIAGEALNFAMSESYNPLGRYDSGGWWEFHSLKNYFLHLLGWVGAVSGFAMAHWSDREQVVGAACAQLAGVGMHPVFCPALSLVG